MKQAADQGSAALDQLAFADFVASGELDRHLRRVRPIYRRRRDALLSALARHLPDLQPVGASAGLHFLAWLPRELEEETLVRSAAGAGVGLAGLAAERIAPGDRGAIVFGYGSVAESAINNGVRRLASVVSALTHVQRPVRRKRGRSGREGSEPPS